MNYSDNFVGRYRATKVALSAIGGSPSIAYKVNDRLSLGGGVSIIHTQFEESIAINQSALVPGPGTLADGKVKFDNLTDLGKSKSSPTPICCNLLVRALSVQICRRDWL